jgi:hypothetical protein
MPDADSGHQDHGKRIVQLNHELAGMPEYALLRRIDTLGTSLRVFQRNYAELRKLLAFCADPQSYLSLWDRKNIEKQHALWDEVTRLIHNYVASAKTLIEHTRRLYKDLRKGGLTFEDYQEKVTRDFASDPLAKFIEDLRDYCMHYAPPPVFSELKYTRKPARFTTGLKLNVDSLQLFGGWSTPAKKYLSDQGKAVDLLGPVDDYHAKVIAFHKWFKGRLMQLHARELGKVAAKQRELAALVIPDEVRMALTEMKEKGTRPDEALTHLLSLGQRKELKDIPVSSGEYAKKLVAFIEGYAPLADDLKDQIRRTCAESH